MGLSAAERNRRKRERKKTQKQKIQQEIDPATSADAFPPEDAKAADPEAPAASDDETDVEYVPEEEPLLFVVDTSSGDVAAAETGKGDDDAEDDPVAALRASLRSFYARSSIVDDPEEDAEDATATDAEEESGRPQIVSSAEEDLPTITSLRRRKKMERMTVAQLKRSVRHPELVEAADVTSPDPRFLLEIKGMERTVEVPRHWCMKRKYLQGKRGIEKPPFALPDFIARTGITTIRSQTQEEEGKASQKQKGRNRAAPKMGRMDVDYRVLHDAFFKYQTKPPMTGFGDLYYEGKEYEKRGRDYSPGVITEELKIALGMERSDHPPPWLINMQRYGPPPSYPNLKIPGVNAPIPEGAQYGYHGGGWGKPPVDAYGRPLYGDVFGRAPQDPHATNQLITSDGKTVAKTAWGALPDPGDAESSSEEEESSDEEDGSDEEDEDAEVAAVPDPIPADGTVSVVPAGEGEDVSAFAAGPVDLRKNATVAREDAGDAPAGEKKQLYTVLHSAEAKRQEGAMFSSDHVYVMPGQGPLPAGGAESMLSKAGTESMLSKTGTESVLSKSGAGGDGGLAGRKRKDLKEEEEELTKKFKF